MKLDDAAQAVGQGINLEQVELPEVEQAEPQQGFSFDFGFLGAKTGDGAIDDYMEHPLNAGASRGIAQVLRGVTGMFGAVDLAIVDIVLGLLAVLKERKGAAGA